MSFNQVVATWDKYGILFLSLEFHMVSSVVVLLFDIGQLSQALKAGLVDVIIKSPCWVVIMFILSMALLRKPWNSISVNQMSPQFFEHNIIYIFH